MLYLRNRSAAPASSIDLQYLADVMSFSPCAYRSVLHIVVLASSHRQMRNWMLEMPTLEYLITGKHLLNVHNGKLYFIRLAKKDNLMLMN